MSNQFYIKDLVSKVVDNRGRSPEYSPQKTEYPIIEVDSIRGDRAYPVEDKLTKYVSKKTYETWFRGGHPQMNDLLISTVGSGNIGEVALFKGKGCIAQNLIGLRFKSDLIDSRFIYYLLSSKKYKSMLINLDIGSAQPSIKVPHILNCQIILPEKSHQVFAASFLNKLDNKIELNQKTNQTLEEIAKAIFKSWFVDFDPVRAKAEGRSAGLPPEISDLFPDELVDSEIGETPKGWDITSLSECAVEIESGRRPKGGIDKSLSQGIPSVGAESVAPAGEFDFSKVKYVSTDFAEKMTKGRVQNFDVAIYKDGAGLESINPKVAIWGEHFPFSDFFVNEHVFLLRSQVLGQPFLYHLVSSRGFWMQLSVKGTAKSAQPGLNQTEVTESTFIRPSKFLITAFNTAIQPLLERQFLLGKEIEVLSELRDLLLPKLISGELRIPDAEKFLEEAGI